MARKILVRLVGAIACMAAVVTGLDAEAGWRHRRGCCSDSCCYTPCCTTVYYTTPCYETCGCGTTCSSCSSCSTCSTWRDACGYCHTSCGTTVVTSPVIVSECCVASAAAPAAVQTASQGSPTPARTASVVAR